MKNQVLNFILSLVLFAANNYGQQIVCGHESIVDYQKKMAHVSESQYMQLQQALRDYINFQQTKQEGHRSAPGNSVYTIPVVFHVVYPNGQAYGTGSNISYAQIVSQLNALNAAFSKNYPAYNGQTHPSYAVSADIKFCLARTAMPATVNFYNGPQGTEYGVMRYANSAASNHQINATSATNLLSLTHPSPAHFPFANYLNIWLVSTIGSGPGTTMGYAPTPLMAGYPLDGVVMRADVVGDNSTGSNFTLGFGLDQGKVLVHEVGHYLNLYHIFQNGCSGTNGPGASNDACDLNGDFVCDTEPCTTQNFNCSLPIPNTCQANYAAGTTTLDMIENYMSYADDNCMNTFTSGQSQRMWATLATLRQNLWQLTNLSATGVMGNNGCLNALLLANITKSTNNHCAGASFTLSNIVSGNTAISRTWTMPGASPSTATGNTVQVSYANPGAYWVNLSVSDGTNTVSDSIQILVANCALDSSLLDRSHWYFGNYAELDFSTIPPTAGNSALTFSTMFNGFESTVSMSDKTGNLLFYTNSIDFWNQNHQQVNNSTVFETWSSTPGVISLPLPGDSSKYIIISSPHTGGDYDSIYYAVYDKVAQTLTAKRGFRNDSLPLSYGEPLTVVPHCNGRDYWILCRPNYSLTVYDRAYAMLLTPAGPANIQTVTVSRGLSWGISGQWKSNHRGDRLIHAVFGNAGTGELHDFDASTGRITNPITVGQSVNMTPTGAIFSPNDSIVYVMRSFGANYMSIIQVDVASLTTQTLVSHMLGYKGLQFEMGPDKNIYVSQTDFLNTTMGRINNPDSWNNAVFAPGVISFPNGINPFGGICNFIDVPPKPAISIDFNTTVLSCAARKFEVDSCWRVYTANWQFGDGATANGLSVSHTYTSPGAYAVKLVLSIGTYSLAPIIKNTVVVSNTLSITGPGTICIGDPYPGSYATSSLSGATYLWTSTNANVVGSNTLSYLGVYPLASGPLTMSVTAQQGLCTAMGTKTVFVSPAPVISFSLTNAQICLGQTIQLQASPPGGVYSGSGVTGANFSATSPGQYTVMYAYSDANACSATAVHTLQVEKCTNINAVGKISPSRIFPNPTSGRFYLAGDLTTAFTLELLRADGAKVFEQHIESNRSAPAEIILPDVIKDVQGVYLIIITDKSNNNKEYFKLVVQ